MSAVVVILVFVIVYLLIVNKYNSNRIKRIQRILNKYALDVNYINEIILEMKTQAIYKKDPDDEEEEEDLTTPDGLPPTPPGGGTPP